MKDLIQIIYMSSSKGIFDEQRLLDLLQLSKRENSRHAITGLLLHKDGSFIQVIEGEKRDIEQLYHNIENDRSHTGIMLLIKEPIQEREFPDWSMAIHNVPSSMANQFSDFFTAPAGGDQLSSKAKILLLHFKNL
jgi:hypothetical protein